MERHNNIDKGDLESYIDRVQFQPVSSDADAVFEKIQYRIKYGKTMIIGVSPVWKYVAVAASVALLLLSSLFVLIPREKKEIAPIAYLDIKATVGSKTRVVLPDSSVVWLNSNAGIRYPQQFTEQKRTVELEGEALFTVAKDKEKPFIVSIGGMQVQVLGTVFNIHSDAKTNIIETTLLEGSVAVFSGNNKTKNADLILSPNEQVLYNKENGKMAVRPVRASMYSSWVYGEFYFENNTLQEIMNTLERAFDVSIHIKSESLKKKRFTAQFFHNETLDEILSVLQISAKYKYEKIQGEIFITDK
ncbi:MAG: DUF4974 domain-containing protein [Parabacteroides sp.]|nr:DUF4974 domain-containing protein [Parabacteroides sp.]